MSRSLAFPLLLLAAGSIQAATTPYFEDFDDDTLGSSTPAELAPESGAFSTAGPGWSVVAGGINGQSYQNTFTTDNTASSAGINFAGSLGGSVATANDFSLSTQFRFLTGTGATATVGLGFLGADNAFTANGYFVDLGFGGTAQGTFRFVRNGAAQAGSTINAGTPALNVTYTLTLSGDYYDSNSDATNDRLLLTATISGGSLSGTITLDDSAAFTGTYFGYRNRNNQSDLSVQMDNFNLAVIPEPSTAALLGLTAGVFGFARRRRR